MIGEIRDAETATAALQAALTGHRLLSSMHTLTPADALVRLQQMGAPPYVIASALAGVLNVRLARLLCRECRHARPLEDADFSWLSEARQWPERTLYEADGCEACLGSGHAGRTGLGEWVVAGGETPEALTGHRPVGVIAQTLACVASARPAMVDMLREGRIAPAERHRLTGLMSLTSPKENIAPDGQA
jgi:type II secretory ATPase GspE/PulE/Tfp pilus assembly ATPase PilB-like protein